MRLSRLQVFHLLLLKLSEEFAFKAINPTTYTAISGTHRIEVKRRDGLIEKFLEEGKFVGDDILITDVRQDDKAWSWWRERLNEVMTDGLYELHVVLAEPASKQGPMIESTRVLTQLSVKRPEWGLLRS